MLFLWDEGLFEGFCYVVDVGGEFPLGVEEWVGGAEAGVFDGGVDELVVAGRDDEDVFWGFAGGELVGRVKE